MHGDVVLQNGVEHLTGVPQPGERRSWLLKHGCMCGRLDGVACGDICIEVTAVLHVRSCAYGECVRLLS
jgi:hypothetical protein